MLAAMYVLAVIALAVVAIRRPWIGVYAYTFVSLAFVHRFLGGVAFDFPAAKLLAVATLVGLVTTREWYRWPHAREIQLVAALLLACSISTFVTALEPTIARAKLGEFVKVLIMVVPALLLFQEARRFRLWVATIVASLATLGVIAAVRGVSCGLNDIIFGPPSSVVGDNNALGFALALSLPMLMATARLQLENWRRVAVEAALVAALVGIAATHSRGALVVSCCVVPLFLLATRDRRLFVIVVATAAVVAWSTPRELQERWATIRPGVQRTDSSGAQRMQAWYVAWRLGLDHPVFGAGFRPFSEDVYDRYLPGNRFRLNAHNVFLQVFAEHGIVGLTCFVALLATVMTRLVRLARRARRDALPRWVYEHALMLGGALVAYLAGGFFLNLPYFELLYWLIAASVLLDVIASSPMRTATPVVGESPAYRLVRRVGRTR